MNWNYKEFLPVDFSPASRVWVYQASRLLSISEALQAEDLLNDFTEQWQSHGVPVKGYANLFFGQFIILMADESATGVSGCSTDSSVRLIKQLEQAFNIQLFDRQLLAFIVRDNVQLIPMTQLKYAVDNHFIEAGTLYFNNTVQTKSELENNWLIPVRESWLAGRISFSPPVA